MQKEYKIGETFQYGLVKLRCIKAPCESRFESCYRCVFYDDWNDTCLGDRFVGECERREREDKTDVIFEEVEEE